MDVRNCSLNNWYHVFKNLTVKSIFIEIKPEILDYLGSESILLPDDYQSKSADDCRNDEALKKFVNDINSGIKKLNGEVIPKFTWSVPKDAIWIAHDRSLKCRNSDEVLLLLKSSNQVTHDIDYSQDLELEDVTQVKEPINHVLALREWIDIKPDSEFRCYIKNNMLLAISQRNVQYFFSEVLEKHTVIKDKIIKFFNCEIKGKFFNKDFTLDIFLDDDCITIIDFNPFNITSSSLLYTYEELNQLKCLNDADILFRCITSQNDVRSNLHSWDAYPEDFLHLSNGLDMNKFIDLMNLNNCNKSEDSDSD